jgi:hypothetical protein
MDTIQNRWFHPDRLTYLHHFRSVA